MTKLQELKESWLAAKAAEKQAQANRLQVEGEIWMLVEKHMKDSGVNNIEEGIKITTGYSEKWDQEVLRQIKNQWKGNLWPFKSEFKKDSTLLKVLQQTNTDGYLLVTKALTLTPSKPTFSMEA